MSTEDKKRYYWLKLDRNFFKRHDIKIIEATENGKDYILFYLKLLCEATSHEGELRFSETIPYDEKMLSIVTNTNLDIVKAAMSLFIELGMMEVLEDRTIYMTEMTKMIGSETHAAIRKREQRNKGDIVPQLSQVCRIEKEKEKEKEKELEREGDNTHTLGKYNNIHLTGSEIDELRSIYGQEAMVKSIERVSDYKKQHGKEYASDFPVVDRFAHEDYGEVWR